MHLFLTNGWTCDQGTLAPAELHTFAFTCDSSWLETFQWDRFLLENGNLLNAKYFTWNMERFDELLANKVRFPYPTEWHSSFPLLPGLGSGAASCARDPRLAATAGESKSPEGCRSIRGSLENVALAKAVSTFQSPAELGSRSQGSWCRHCRAPG